MGVLVNRRAFDDLQRKVSELAQGRPLPDIARRFGVVALKLIADEFQASRDPYGQPWAPLKRPRSRRGSSGRADKPLLDTGRMRASVAVRASDELGVDILIPVDYASYHQKGTRRMVRRQILPEASTGGLGPIWTQALAQEAARALNEHFGRPA